MNPLDAKIAELRRRFVGRAGEEVATIDAALAQGDRHRIGERAHAIAGIAGMFGFEEVGEAALALEAAAMGDGELAAPAARLRALLSALG